ncbi:MAG TPA: DUF433 domain-containing protein [Actinomycetota bacterium]
MLTVPKAAAVIGRSPETIRRWIRAGRLRSTKVGTQHMIDQDDLAEFIRTTREQVGESPVRYEVVESAFDEPLFPELRKRITANPEVLVGKAAVRGTRISVELVLELFAAGWTEEEVLDNYPTITRDDLRACFLYAYERIEGERILPFDSMP